MSTNCLSAQKWEQVAREAEFNASKMASLCAISDRHLQRIFKKHFQCTPSRWLRELQCHLAKELITKGYSSKAAAAEVKFATESHFCREFKKVFGEPPQRFAPNDSAYMRLLGLGRNDESANPPPAQHATGISRPRANSRVLPADGR